jgi:hypothetical protein
LEKHPSQIFVTDEGMRIDERGTAENASLSIRDNFESRSKPTNVRQLDPEKHFAQITSTEEGIWIERKPVPQNAALSNRESREPTSKERETAPRVNESGPNEAASASAGIQKRVSASPFCGRNGEG